MRPPAADSGRLPDATCSALKSDAEEYFAASENYTQALSASWQATFCYGVNSAEEVAAGKQIVLALYRVTDAKTRLKHAVAEVCRSAPNADFRDGGTATPRTYTKRSHRDNNET